MPSRSHSSAFQGWRSVAGAIPLARARSRFSGESSTSSVDPGLGRPIDLAVVAAQLVEAQADARQPLRCVVVGVRRAVAGHVDRVPGGAPAGDDVDRARVGLGGEHEVGASESRRCIPRAAAGSGDRSTK